MFLDIANHLWQSTLFVLCVALLCCLFRRDGANVRYWLWWIASVKFLVPFSLLTAIGSALAATASVSLVPEAWTNTVTVVARPFASDAVSWSPGVVLSAIWGAGSLAVLARWWARVLQLRRVLAEAERLPEPLLAGARSIRVYRSEAPVEPGVIGILRTALLLPAGIEQRLNRAQFEAVLAHEFCHIRRRDNLTASIHMLVEAMFWFHPLVWWIGARLIDERERACDEMVVALGHDRQTYAESILDVCEHYVASPLPCAAGISGSGLKRRITLIMRYQGMNSLMFAKKLLLGTAAVGLVVIPVVAGLTVHDSAIAQDNAPPLPAASAGDNPAADPASASAEFMPIVKVAPIYPPRAAARGLEGYVVISYTVTATGSVEDVSVVESSATLFEQPAIDSARKYKYQPRMIDGQAVEVAGVTTKIAFELADDDTGAAPAGPDGDGSTQTN
jgi:bla regulator protein BlaR1